MGPTQALPVTKGTKYAANFWSALPAADPPPPPRAPVPLPTCALPTRAVHQFDYVTAHLNGCTA